MGSGIRLQPQVPPEHDMGQWLSQFYANTEALPEEFLADCHDAREFHRVPGLAVEEWAMD